MRLSWKLFFITTPLFVLFLTIFGTWMIQENFMSSLGKEIERCMTENQMFQNSYELTLYGLSDNQKEQMTIEQLVESFYRSGNKVRYDARIYDENSVVLYESSEQRLAHSVIEKLNEDENVGYELVRVDRQTYVVVVCKSSMGVYIETAQDITNIFEERDAMYSRYQTAMLAMTFLVGGVTFLVLFFVMRNMQKLSRATRQFARGQYDTRVRIRSTDEIGMLASDFNWMANAMNIQMEQLKNDVRRQEEFTAAFAHELKTPLTSIIGYADTIRQMELTPEETDMCADYIYRQGKRLQSLSYKLLEMTMAENREPDMQRVWVPELLEMVAQTARQSLAEKSVTLYQQAQGGFICGDRDLLSSVFLNLIDNARKASRPGGRIWMSGVTMTGGYCVTVQDEAGGLPDEELARITEAFYMVDKSRARKEGGAGLGLALCQKILDLHQGGWQIENANGGLRVTVLLAMPQTPRREYRRRRGPGGTEQERV